MAFFIDNTEVTVTVIDEITTSDQNLLDIKLDGSAEPTKFSRFFLEYFRTDMEQYLNSWNINNLIINSSIDAFITKS